MQSLYQKLTFIAGTSANDSNGDLYKPKNNNMEGNYITLTVDAERNLNAIRLTNKYGSWSEYGIVSGEVRYVPELDLNIYKYYRALHLLATEMRSLVKLLKLYITAHKRQYVRMMIF